jgi:hypothetical protein
MRAHIHLLLVCMLAVASLTGCARRVVQTKFNHRTLRQIQIAGHVRWTGRLPGGKITVTATPVPQSIAAIGSITSDHYLSRPDAGVESYDFHLGIVTALEISSRERHWPFGLWRPRPPRREIHTVQYYVVTVVAPPGWRATPAMRKILQSTRNADFVLTRR